MTQMNKRHSKSPRQHSTPPESVNRFSALQWAAAIVVLLGTFFVFLPATQNDFIDWDDTDNFIRNQQFRGLGSDNIAWMFSTFHMGHYQPLTWLTLGLDYTWGGKVFGEHPTYGYGMDPRSYHITNVVLHAVNSMLVFFIARILLATAIPNSRNNLIVLGATCSALVFGLHPLRVESVAWATERRDLLSGLFVLLSVLSYLRAHGEPGRPRVKWKLAALAFFALSLLSKVIGVTLPVVLLILDWFPLRRLEPNPARWLSAHNRAVLLEKVPYFALSTTFALIATIGQGTNRWLVTLEMHGIFERIVQSMYGLMFYPWKTLVPVNLSPLYQLRLPLDVTEPRFVISSLLLLAAIVFGIVFRQRASGIIGASLAYAIMILPVLGLMQNGPQLVADRYSYLPCISLAVLAGGAMTLLLQRDQKSFRAAMLVSAFLISFGLSWMTLNQIRVWRDTQHFWTYLYHFDPSNGYAQNGYGYVLLKQGDLDQAISVLRQAIATYPQNEKSHQNLWDALKQKGDTSSLISAYQAAAGVDTLAVIARFELGNLMLERGDHQRAAELFREVVDLDPSHVGARTNLGVTFMRLKQVPDAVRELQAAVHIDPKFFSARYNLGLALRLNGQVDEAAKQLRIAVQLRPDHAGARTALESLGK